MIAYIAGYGRSGSTLFDVILDNHPAAFGAGEMTWFFRRAMDGHACTCGQPLTQCEIWSEVLAAVQRRLPGVSLQSLADITLKCESAFPRRHQQDIYFTAWKTVFDSLRQVTGCELIVDSSKSNRVGCRRFSLLTTLYPEQVRMIHLVRSASSIVSSLQRGSNKSLAAGSGRRLWGGSIRGLASWSFSNIAAEWQCSQKSRQRIVVRYENLVANPRATLEQIGSLVELDMTPVIDIIGRDGSFTSGHGVDGNRMRRSKTIRLHQGSDRTEPLSPWDRGLVKLVMPVERRYAMQASSASSPLNAA